MDCVLLLCSAGEVLLTKEYLAAIQLSSESLAVWCSGVVTPGQLQTCHLGDAVLSRRESGIAQRVASAKQCTALMSCRYPRPRFGHRFRCRPVRCVTYEPSL